VGCQGDFPGLGDNRFPLFRDSETIQFPDPRLSSGQGKDRWFGRSEASHWSLIARFMFGMLGPLNWPIDLIWLTNDIHRQALRDKFANTYVIRAAAQSSGTGKVVFRQYDILFYNFLFREVEM
jgi:hypothetical protein